MRRGDELGAFNLGSTVVLLLADPGLASRGGRGRPRARGPGPVAPKLTVGVVSDTHGLVRPEAIEALRGSDVILHAGDIGGSHVLAGARASSRR